jgi:hypothetical protein
MATASRLTQAVRAIDKAGILLVYPLSKRAEPPSLWHALHPGAVMNWAWDADADPRIAALWQLREELASTTKVVYSKWYRGRATFFSRSVFRAMLARLHAAHHARFPLSLEAKELLAALEANSPLSTKELRRQAGLQGRASEGAYTRAMRELWSRLLIVGMGEVQDGAFPSLAIGATRTVFEDLWQEAQHARFPSRRDDDVRLTEVLAAHPLFMRAWNQQTALDRAAQIV